MNDHGWISIHRSLLDHEIWVSNPFTDGQAWVDLIMLANHKEGLLKKRGIRIEIPRGYVGWSEVSLAKRWKWSRGKLRRFFVFLEQENMIKVEQQKNKVTTLIKIVNYDQFQKIEHQTVQQTEHQTIQQTDNKRYSNNNNKNDNNEKNNILAVEKKVKGNGFHPPTIDEVREYCLSRNSVIVPEFFHDHYEANGWMRGTQKMKDWKATIRTWENKRKESNQQKIYDPFEGAL